MSDRRLQDRLQPSLLDRLTDDAPGQRTEPRGARAIDARRLRDIIQRDLGWLLNTCNLDDQLDGAAHPHAAASVLNYGVADVAGNFSVSARAEMIRDAIRRAIATFEPRIDPATLEVILRSEENARRTVISYDIRADMWAQPLPLSLYLRSEVDLTTGTLELDAVG
ncbi:type VI secretion system baseplate subunit TssE [Mangrovicoccus algicola]|uniref:Type VI secretion system baseplate subunit TssE n=1 Tax=Mangrovicoccus algicola TaxID=2771008 RepID=A0A8J6YXN3_9RHOB|nr:type VI secretion system baseplate subunit TssE [Mangrovicoccus algicola]MBE3639607.1 type VI secretion system baseplate subunit TssE [Mangrovicoccus algicola]